MGPSLRTTELFISGLIVANAIVIGLETDNQEEELWAVSCSKKNEKQKFCYKEVPIDHKREPCSESFFKTSCRQLFDGLCMYSMLLCKWGPHICYVHT